MNDISNFKAFNVVGIWNPSSLTKDFESYQNWLKQSMHASMSYLEKYPDQRQNPMLLFDDLKSVVLVALRYSKRTFTKAGGASQIASYAHGRDYHKIIKKEAETYVEQLKTNHPSLKYRIFVDTAPIFERAIAREAVDGYIGKNTMFIHREFGSFLLLGEIFLNIALPPTQYADKDKCGSCRRCQSHCPTGALSKDYVLDANRCLSYWSIEHRGCVPLEFWGHFATFYYGCDICQNVCPKNRAKTLEERSVYDYDLFEVFSMTQSDYIRMFGGSALTRAKKDGLRRNALIAMCARSHLKHKIAIEKAKTDTSVMLQETAKQAEVFLSQKIHTTKGG